MDEEKKYYQIKLLDNILWKEIKASEKISRVFKKICISLNINDIKPIFKLVESVINSVYTLENIKIIFSKRIEGPNFDMIYLFCRLIFCEDDEK